MRILRAIFILALGIASAANAQVRFYVDAAKPAGGNGSSWAAAFRHLQDALAVANALPAPPPGQPRAEIWVRTGTYYPDEGTGRTPDLRTNYFSPADGVRLYGGFAGTETTLHQREIPANPTVLSGDLKQNDLPGFFNTTDNAFHVVQFMNVGNATVIDGFIVSGGYADGNDANLESVGGGIHVVFSSPVISRCVLTRNFSRLPGAGVRLASSNSLILNCRFVANHSQTAGGGLAFSSSNSSLASPHIFGCEFLANSAEAYSGAIRITLSFNATLRLTNSTIHGNHAPSTGGLGAALTNANAQVLVTGCILWGNRDDTGEAENAQVFKVNQGKLTLRNSCVQGLTALFAPVNCIASDPRFVDPLGPDNRWGTGDENLRLFVGSPAIDAADNTALPADVLDYDGDGNIAEPVPFDLAGVLRRFDDTQTPDTGIGTPPLVDMGAYEFVPIDPNKPGDRIWVKPGGGLFAATGNWFPDKIPTSLDTPIFDLAPAYTVEFLANTQTRKLVVSRGIVTLDLNTRLLELTELAEDAARIGPFAQQPATLRVRDGELRAASIVSVGGGLGSEGTLLLDEPGSRLNVLALALRSGIVRLDNGGFLKASTITILRHGRLEGRSTASTLVTFALSNFGEVSPGGDGIGTLELSGAYVQFPPILSNSSSSGLLRVQLAGAAHFDRLRAASVDLGGGLFVELAQGFAPAPSDVFDVVVATGDLAGRFDVAFLPAIPDDDERFLYVDYGARSGVVSIKVGNLSNLLGLESGLGASLSKSPAAGTLADLDGDGFPELIVCAPDPANPATSPGSVFILRNKGAPGGAWQGFDLAGVTQISVGRNPVAVVATDVDLLPGAEIAVVHNADDNVWILRRTEGTWIKAAEIPCNDDPTSIAVVEGPGDAGNSLVVGSTTYPNPPNVPVGQGVATLLVNNSTMGNIIFEPDPLPAGPRPTSVAAKPLTPTLQPDLITANGNGGGVSILPSGESFGPPIHLPTGVDPVHVVVGDLNADGLADLVVANASGSLSILINLGEYVLAPAVNLPIGPNLASVVLADLDDDGDLDLVVIADDDSAKPTIFTLRNDTVGNDAAFAHPVAVPTDGTPVALVTGDLDGDGVQDVVALNLGGGEAPGEEVSVFLAAPRSVCRPDCEQDGDLDLFDFLCFQQHYVNQDPYADFERDGDWDIFDYLAFLGAFADGCGR